MEHDITAFWSDIKKYEEALVNDPASYCFVPLADLYRRMGLIDDAVHVAKKGCDLHPDYVGGYMALGRAYFEKGMKPESKAALEKVVSSTPDNLMARRILSQIYVEDGETAAANENLLFILSQNPDDKESQVLLSSLKSSGYDARHSEYSGASGIGDDSFDLSSFELSLEDDDDIIEDAELLEEFDDVEETKPLAVAEPSSIFAGEETLAVSAVGDNPPEILVVKETAAREEFIFSPPETNLPQPAVEIFVEESSDPLRTATMAELYASQGFLKRALTIYRELLEKDPDNAEWKNRLYELKTAIDEDTVQARKVVTSDGEAEYDTVLKSGNPEVAQPSATITTDDRTLETLEQWLDTLRRKR